MISRKIKKVIVVISILIFCIFFFPIQKVNAYQLNNRAYPASIRSKITVYIHPSLEGIYSNVDGSTKQWAGLAKINFSRTYDFNNPNLTQTYVNTDNGTYGVCYYTSDTYKEIAYHKAFKNSDQSVQAETVVHEVGHALGLSHTQAENNSISVMRALGFNGKAYPLSDDKTGIAAIYKKYK